MIRSFPRPVFDATTGAKGGGGFGNLPEWLDEEAAAFAADYEGKLHTLDAAGLLACVQRYEEIDVIAGRLMSFAGLRYYQNTMDSERAQFISAVQERITDATTPLVFFSLEFNRLEDEALAARLAENVDLARYKPVFDRMRDRKSVV